MGKWSSSQTGGPSTDLEPFVDSTKLFGFDSKTVEDSFYTEQWHELWYICERPLYREEHVGDCGSNFRDNSEIQSDSEYIWKQSH